MLSVNLVNNRIRLSEIVDWKDTMLVDRWFSEIFNSFNQSFWKSFIRCYKVMYLLHVYLSLHGNNFAEIDNDRVFFEIIMMDASF